MEYIIPRLIGGLGNQLFTFAAAYILQQRMGQSTTAIALPPPRENVHSTRDYYNELFSKFSNTCRIDLPALSLAEFCVFAQQSGLAYFSPQKCSFDTWDPSAAPTKTFCLEGYFQYYPPLEPHIADIRSRILESLPQVPAANNCVFIHVRRGDYVEKQEIHYLQPDSYYLEALSHFDTTATTFLIVSDDPSHCKDHPVFASLPKKLFIDTPNELEALSVMASCKAGAVIANSTFSWWGAILANPQIVIVPSHWCVDKPKNLFPAHWTQI